MESKTFANFQEQSLKSTSNWNPNKWCISMIRMHKYLDGYNWLFIRKYIFTAAHTLISIQLNARFANKFHEKSEQMSFSLNLQLHINWTYCLAEIEWSEMDHAQFALAILQFFKQRNHKQFIFEKQFDEMVTQTCHKHKFEAEKCTRNYGID